jgi:hypothetical protein
MTRVFFLVQARAVAMAPQDSSDTSDWSDEDE